MSTEKRPTTTAGTESIRQTIEQARAKFAFEKVAEVAGRHENFDFQSNYRGLVEKLPAMIQTNGLGQTLAFLYSKGTNKEGSFVPNEKAEARLYQHLRMWLCRTDWPIGPYPGAAPQGERPELCLLDRLTSGDSRTYRRATVEALALIAWLKRFAGGMLTKKESRGG